MNVLFKDVVPSSRKAKYHEAIYNNTKYYATVVREAISKNSVLKDIMPENPTETLSGISVKVPIQFRSNGEL